MANLSNLDVVRHRSARAVEHYKKQVLPIYQGNQGTSPFHELYYGSSENLNGTNATGRDRNSGEEAFGGRQQPFINKTPPDGGEGHLVRGGHRATIHGTGSTPWNRSSDKKKGSSRSSKSPPKDVKDRTPPKRGRQSGGLYRSNSNLELDNNGDSDEETAHNRSLHRDYGSTSSVDVLGGENSESFFNLLKDFRNLNLDQRSPAPAKLNELLKGGFERTQARADLHRTFNQIANGSLQYDRSGATDEVDSPRSKVKPKQPKDRKSRAKSITNETRPGFFKFLGKTDESGTKTADTSDSDLRAEHRQRVKSFGHYDCQSIGFDLSLVLERKSQSQSSSGKKTSGASAAAALNVKYESEADDDDGQSSSQHDEGDGRNNGLVQSCHYFRNELGGEEERTICLNKLTAHKSGRPEVSGASQNIMMTMPRSVACCGISILDSAPTPTKILLPHVVLYRGRVIEFVDRGASYYRHFFYGYDHQNYFGIDDNYGPVAVSIRREKLEDRGNHLGKPDFGNVQYRVICRTSELATLRGSIIEEAIPSNSSSSRITSSRGVSAKEIIEFLLPEITTSCLKQGLAGQKTSEQLLKLDEQSLNKTYKVGVMYCKAGQSTEEEMYNNEVAGPALEEFLRCIGEKVKLKGFDKYRAQLDNKTDSTGTHSVYNTFDGCEIMFHVSTMLPYTSTNKQQLLRKRHIGNDIVTIVFQEPGSYPFSPKEVRSQFQHVFIIVRAHNPCSDNTCYSVAVSRSLDIPPFGPHIPDNAFFPKGPEFADFLLAKVINAENAAHKSEKFLNMAIRTRTEYLKDLAQNHVTSTLLDGSSKFGKFGLGSVKKKDKPRQKVIPDMFSTGALIWNVEVEDFGQSKYIDAILGISDEVLVIVEEESKDVIFTVHCGAVIGWTSNVTSVRIFYNQGESIHFKVQDGEMEDMTEITTRLSAVTQGCETKEMTLKRNGMGQLGFHVQQDGIVTDVEAQGFAAEAGLKKGSRLVEICKIFTATLTHDEIVDLLRTSATVKVTLIPPLENGSARGVATLHSNCYYTSLTTLNAAMQASENSTVFDTITAPRKSHEPSPSDSTDSCLKSSQHTGTDSLPRKSLTSGIDNSSRKSDSLPWKSHTSSEDYTYILRDMMSGAGSNLSIDKTHFGHSGPAAVSSSNPDIARAAKVTTEKFYCHSRELSSASSDLSSSREVFWAPEDQVGDMSGPSPASPVARDGAKNYFQCQRGSLTLPLQKKNFSGSRGEMRTSAMRGLSPNYREFRDDKMRAFALPHAQTDPGPLPGAEGTSKISEKVLPTDDGYSSLKHDHHDRHERTDSGSEVKHERISSRDSSDYSLVGVYVELDRLGFFSGRPGGAPALGSRHWANSRQPQPARPPQDQNNSSNSSSYGPYTPNTDPTLSNPPSGNQGAIYQAPRKSSAPSDIGVAVAAVQHGNIALELLKQTQNTKYLLTQGQEAGRGGVHSVNSSVSLSDSSFSSGSSHTSAQPTGNMSQRTYAEQMAALNRVIDETSRMTRQRADAAAGIKVRGSVAHKRSQLETSPISSANSSPRSSHRNLSGMSSEESLNSRLRPGVTTKASKVQSPNNLQEELMRLIDPDLSDKELRSYNLKATEQPRKAKLKRTMSDESLHNAKGGGMSMSLDSNMADVIFTSTQEKDKSKRSSPGALQQGASRDKEDRAVPLPESTSRLEWSSLVSVATKAMEQDSTDVKGAGSVEESTQSKSMEVKKTWSTAGPQSYSSSPPVWRSVVPNPQQRIQELEAKVERLESDLDKERKENAELEAEVRELRIENARLQEESQTAAAQLRKFTEWFFTTIDRQ